MTLTSPVNSLFCDLAQWNYQPLLWKAVASGLPAKVLRPTSGNEQ